MVGAQDEAQTGFAACAQMLRQTGLWQTVLHFGHLPVEHCRTGQRISQRGGSHMGLHSSGAGASHLFSQTGFSQTGSHTWQGGEGWGGRGGGGG